MELSPFCLPTAAGELQTPTAPRLLRDPSGQGQHPWAGHCDGDLPAPPGEDLAGPKGAWGGSVQRMLNNVLCPLSVQAEDKISMPLADRSLLGTTASILCGLLPVYWA